MLNYHVVAERGLSPELRQFVESNHYKKAARSLTEQFTFSLYHEELLVGVAVYGLPTNGSVAKKYGAGTLELRRFCLINEAPRNSESFFLGATLRQLKKAGVPKVVSYADANEGHIGTIYKASNWKYLGKEKYGQRTLCYKGRMISARCVYQKDGAGQYYKSALLYQEAWKKGLATFVMMKPKHVYMYDFKENK